jgi:hypothetical protein
MEIKKWRGLRNTTAPERFRPGDLATAFDVEISDTGQILSRRGFTQVSATAGHSLYANHTVAVLVEGSTLKALEPDFTRTTLRTLSTAAPVSYDTVQDTIYYSNGTDTGRLVGRTPKEWGVAVPTSQPVASAAPGSLPPGRYLYAMTFLRSDGHESGTDMAASIDLPTGGGIRFTSMQVSTNPDVSDKILYLSSPNGEVLYKAVMVANGATSALYASNALDLKTPLTTQFAGPPPAGNVVRGYNGSACVVAGDVVYYSDPYNLELFRLDTNFLRFPGQVAVYECVNDGIYVATTDLAGDDPETNGGTWYLGGSRMDGLKSTQVFDYGAIPGTGVRTLAAYFDTQTSDEGGAISASNPAVVWASRHGVCVGFDGGRVQNLTEAMYSFPVAQRGAGLVRQARGFVQYLAVLRGSGALNNNF